MSDNTLINKFKRLRFLNELEQDQRPKRLGHWSCSSKYYNIKEYGVNKFYLKPIKTLEWDAIDDDEYQDDDEFGTSNNMTKAEDVYDMALQDDNMNPKLTQVEREIKDIALYWYVIKKLGVYFFDGYYNNRLDIKENIQRYCNGTVDLWELSDNSEDSYNYVYFQDPEYEDAIMVLSYSGKVEVISK